MTWPASAWRGCNLASKILLGHRLIKAKTHKPAEYLHSSKSLLYIFIIWDGMRMQVIPLGGPSFFYYYGGKMHIT